jgi:hypothetical protein
MGQPVAITNFEHSAADLRRFASREKSGEVVRRLLGKLCISFGFPYQFDFCKLSLH